MVSDATAYLTTFLKQAVSESLDHDFQDDDLEQRKVRYLLNAASADLDSIVTLSNCDGKIDAYAIEEDGQGGVSIHVWQLSGPTVAEIRKGRVRPPPGRKLENDIIWLGITLKDGQPQLSNSAVDAFTAIHDGLESATRARLNLHVLSLYRVTDERRARLVALAVAKIAVALQHEEVDVTCDVWGLDQFAAADAGKLGGIPSLKPLLIDLAGDPGATTHRGALLAFVKPLSLVQYYDKYRGALLHLNARFFLGQGKSTANGGIQKSAQSHAEAMRFHELNNGMVLTCTTIEKVYEASNLVALRLTNPQVVNGGQTLHTLTEVHRNHAKRKNSYVKELVVPVKIVAVSEAPGSSQAKTRAADIARASNTQAALSPRALASYVGGNAELQRAFGKLHSEPWFYEKTDGEWPAYRQMSERHRRRMTGQTELEAFDYRASSGKITARLLRNSDLLESLLSAYGCFEHATSRRVFESEVYPAVIHELLTLSGWSAFAAEPKPKRTYKEFQGSYERAAWQEPPLSFYLLAYILFKGLKQLTMSEARVHDWAPKMWSHMELGGPFETRSDWVAFCERVEAEEFEWTEHVANAMQKPLVFQQLRLLSRRYGALTNDVARQILSLPQFSKLRAGSPFGAVLKIQESRLAKIGDKETPIYSLFQLCRQACVMVYRENRAEIRNMGTKQQTLLNSEWVKRISEKIDMLSGNLGAFKNQLLPNVDYNGTKLSEFLPGI